MKKVITFLLSFVFFVHTANAQEYFTVIKVIGNIVIESTGNSLGIGTSFSQNETLLFKIPESRAAVINPKMGRFLLTSENVNEFKNAKSNFLPPSGKISTRSLDHPHGANDPSLQFRDKYLIMTENKVLIDTIEYPMSAKRYFYMSFDFNNKAINKKLSFISDTLIIKKGDLLTVSGKEIPSPDINQMKLIYYIEGDNYLLKTVGTFAPVFPETSALRQEISIILDKMKINSYEEQFNEIKSFISEFYGNIDDSSLKIWLKEDFGLKQ